MKRDPFARARKELLRQREQWTAKAAQAALMLRRIASTLSALDDATASATETIGHKVEAGAGLVAAAQSSSVGAPAGSHAEPQDGSGMTPPAGERGDQSPASDTPRAGPPTPRDDGLDPPDFLKRGAA